MRKCVFILLLFFLLSTPGFVKELYICCAMGVKEPVEEIAGRFTAESGYKLYFNFSSSGNLAHQIEAGAPCDVFISASLFWSEYLRKREFIKSFIPFATTKLVVVAPIGTFYRNLKDICKVQRLVIGNYRIAPFGRYALSALKNTGLYRCVKDRLILANDVLQAAAWVVTGNADAGVVYYSDYLKFKGRLKLVWVFPNNVHDKILFTVSSLTDLGERFVRFLFTPEAEAILKRWGFEPVPIGR
ncbi:molybdate transport system substrate-binding protein [Thermosulfidibacter takaii ABI70S6]|uniref:Molybdate transport system substrate-binding protein n=1 Tax=Thermosulfidibacter takaii (strain DSM 17441 / JCM 13301 / NBRC 103674 / ABI70S6) TaxID=1298851 RepID=A0A0S3QRH1_THET7|nr:molybdate ABC transporter substrate-binding protein [Thermosulfidibacter takaii]BAT70893.1 molybdate transport system substrate-binding protein [Thermosulfidibacter takaii ABI70S6]